MKTSNAIKVLHISTPLTWRGGEQQLFYLLNNLSTSDKCEQFLFCPDGSVMAKKAKDLVHVITYKKWSGLGLLAALKVKKFCEENEIDAIHAHDSQAHTIAYIAGRLGNETPIAVSRRVDFPVGKSYLSYKKYSYYRVRAIICVSRTVYRIVQTTIKRKNHELHVVYSGVELDTSADVKVNIRGELGIPEDAPLIGNVAAIADHKDYPTFLRTIKRVQEKRPSAHFLIVGDGPLRQQIEKQAVELNIKNLHFLGYRKDAKSILAELDILLFTSKTEGLGTTILDAFVRKVPVVATAAGGVREIVKHMLTGLSKRVGEDYSLAECVEQILASDEVREDLISRAHRKVQEFSHQITAENTLKIYQGILR